MSEERAEFHHFPLDSSAEDRPRGRASERLDAAKGRDVRRPEGVGSAQTDEAVAGTEAEQKRDGAGNGFRAPAATLRERGAEASDASEGSSETTGER